MNNYAVKLANIYEKAKTRPHTRLKVTDTLILSVLVDVEIFRAKRAMMLLKNIGMTFSHPVFNTDYTPLNPNVRCYDNAYEMATEQGLIYCEGLMLLRAQDGGVFPLSHGWCCDEYGTVVDPTCAKYQHIEEVSYLGIPFKRQYVDDWLEVTGYHGILDGHEQGLEIGAHYDDPAFYVQPLRTKQKLAA